MAKVHLTSTCKHELIVRSCAICNDTTPRDVLFDVLRTSAGVLTADRPRPRKLRPVSLAGVVEGPHNALSARVPSKRGPKLTPVTSGVWEPPDFARAVLNWNLLTEDGRERADLYERVITFLEQEDFEGSHPPPEVRHFLEQNIHGRALCKEYRRFLCVVDGRGIEQTPGARTPKVCRDDPKCKRAMKAQQRKLDRAQGNRKRIKEILDEASKSVTFLGTKWERNHNSPSHTLEPPQQFAELLLHEATPRDVKDKFEDFVIQDSSPRAVRDRQRQDHRKDDDDARREAEAKASALAASDNIRERKQGEQMIAWLREHKYTPEGTHDEND